MTDFPIHTLSTAPDGSREPLRVLTDVFGAIPNVAGVMANTPLLLHSFLAAFRQFRSAFTPGERQVLLLSNAVANGCEWAVAFHSVAALNDGVPPGEVAAIRAREVPVDPRLAALSVLTRTLIEKRGHLDGEDRKAFAAAGFDAEQILEVVTGVAVSTMANYVGNIAQPPLEARLRDQAWET